MNYLLIYVKIIDQIIVNHDKHQVQCDIFFKSFDPKVVPQPWTPPDVRFVYAKNEVIFYLHWK